MEKEQMKIELGKFRIRLKTIQEIKEESNKYFDSEIKHLQGLITIVEQDLNK